MFILPCCHRLIPCRGRVSGYFRDVPPFLQSSTLSLSRECVARQLWEPSDRVQIQKVCRERTASVSPLLWILVLGEWECLLHDYKLMVKSVLNVNYLESSTFFPPVLIMTSQCCPLFASFGIAMTCMDESDLRVENQFTVVLASMYASLAL